MTPLIVSILWYSISQGCVKQHIGLISLSSQYDKIPTHRSFEKESLKMLKIIISREAEQGVLECRQTQRKVSALSESFHFPLFKTNFYIKISVRQT